MKQNGDTLSETKANEVAVELVEADRALSSQEEDAINRLLQQDVSGLHPDDQAKYLWWYAVRQGLDPLLKPFDLISVKDGERGGWKKIIYANAGCADQLRRKHSISVEVLGEGPLMLQDEARKDVYVVKVRARMPDGRFHDQVGAVGIDGLGHEPLASAIQKAHTRADRRATLDICGLNLPDVSELDAIVGVRGKPAEPKRIDPNDAEAVESGVRKKR